jgi:hypothetical protein
VRPAKFGDWWEGGWQEWIVLQMGAVSGSEGEAYAYERGRRCLSDERNAVEGLSLKNLREPKKEAALAR